MTPDPLPTRAKVLFLSGLQIHPPVSGGNLRSFALANALQHHGLEVFVYSLVGRKSDYFHLRGSSVQLWPRGIEEFVDRGPLGFLAQFGSYELGVPPVWISAYLRASLASPAEIMLPALLREKLAWCDVVVADFPFVAPIFDAPSARGRLRVLSTHNIEHHMYDDRTRWQSRWLGAAVRTIELKAAAACDILVSCCRDDQQFFETQAKVRHSVLVPNAIDVSRFHGIETGRAATRHALGIGEDVRMFLFTASRWGPNREAFEYLLEFARNNQTLLEQEGIHIVVVGNVAAPVRLAGFTATGKVDVVEPYFAAADAALNPVGSGAGTNVKMCEFIAARLPIVTTPFGARGFHIDDGRTGFVFEREGLAAVLSKVRRRFDETASDLRRMTEVAYAENQSVIDMDQCATPLVEALLDARRRSRPAEHAMVTTARAPSG